MPSDESDQPAHLHSLIRIFTEHILDSQGCKVSYVTMEMLIKFAECAGKLDLHWVHMSEGMFSSITLI